MSGEITTKSGSNVAAIISLISGIISLGFIWIPIFGIVPPILAIAFGGMGILRANRIQTGMGMAVAGLVLGIILGIWKIFIFFLKY